MAKPFVELKGRRWMPDDSGYKTIVGYEIEYKSKLLEGELSYESLTIAQHRSKEHTDDGIHDLTFPQ